MNSLKGPIPRSSSDAMVLFMEGVTMQISTGDPRNGAANVDVENGLALDSVGFPGRASSAPARSLRCLRGEYDIAALASSRYELYSLNVLDI